MGILGVGLNTSNGVGGFLQNPFTREPDNNLRAEDFKEGFIIEELPEEGIGEKIRLVGNQIPIVPFTFGGIQQISKDYYPGNPEANVQVLGARENDVTIRGRISAKRFKKPGVVEIPGLGEQVLSKFAPDLDLRTLPTIITEALDGIRIRGNLCKFSLGEWKRYGIISSTNWDMANLGDYSYELVFSIVSIEEPNRKSPIISNELSLPQEQNNALAAINAQLAAAAANRQVPDAIPTDIGELLNDITSGVAGVVSGVIDFVDGIITTGEEIQGSVNRAVGVIKNAEAELSRFFIRAGRISYNLSFAGVNVPDRYSTSNIISSRMSTMNDIKNLFIQMRKRFQQFAETVPEARHRVKEGDSLQKLSIEFYGNDESWQRILEHNKLASSDLSLIRGTVLEIPRLR